MEKYLRQKGEKKGFGRGLLIGNERDMELRFGVKREGNEVYSGSESRRQN